MGIISTLSNALSGTTGNDPPNEPAQGAYWCDDCNVRVRDNAVEERGLARDDEDTPLCPDCGGAMRFERSHADACAC